MPLTEEGGSGGIGRGRSGRSKNRRSNRNSDARHGRSHRSNLVRGIGCEELKKTWKGSNSQEGQRGHGISPILSRKEWRELQKDERSCGRVDSSVEARKFVSSGAICGEAV